MMREWLQDQSRRNHVYHDGYPRIEAALETYFNDLETWHDQNGTLWEEVG